jgi:hypothetical protein
MPGMGMPYLQPKHGHRLVQTCSHRILNTLSV